MYIVNHMYSTRNDIQVYILSDFLKRVKILYKEGARSYLYIYLLYDNDVI